LNKPESQLPPGKTEELYYCPACGIRIKIQRDEKLHKFEVACWKCTGKWSVTVDTGEGEQAEKFFLAKED
jgi:hypothetical protein